MNDIKKYFMKKKLLLASLMLSTTLVSGCANDNKLIVNTSTIYYDDNTSPSGSLLFDDLESIYLLHYKKDNNEYNKLVYMYTVNNGNSYIYNLENKELLTDIEIIEVECIIPYVMNNSELKFDYDIVEIINIYHNIIDGAIKKR